MGVAISLELERTRKLRRTIADTAAEDVINSFTVWKNGFENAYAQFRANELAYASPDVEGKRNIVRPLVRFFDDYDSYVAKLTSYLSTVLDGAQNAVGINAVLNDFITRLRSMAEAGTPFALSAPFTDFNEVENETTVSLRAAQPISFISHGIHRRTGATNYARLASGSFTMDKDVGIIKEVDVTTFNSDVAPGPQGVLNDVSGLSTWSNNGVTITATFDASPTSVEFEAMANIKRSQFSYYAVLDLVARLAQYNMFGSSDVPAIPSVGSVANLPGTVKHIAWDIAQVVNWMRTTINAYATLTFEYVNEGDYQLLLTASSDV